MKTMIKFGSAFLLCLPTWLYAQTHVGVNTSVGIHIGNQRSSYSHYPQRPPQYPTYPHRPSYPQHPPVHRPPSGHVNGGVNIRYQAPSYTTVNQQTYMWVNGDPNVAQIQSRDRMVITNWRDLGLPAPPTGMYWIFENGRYLLESSR